MAATPLSQQAYQAQVNSLPSLGTVGYFGPKSMTWRLYREPVIVLGSFRALLLQVAHPAVADAVARYSNFRDDALGRGFRTFLAMATLYFGDEKQAREVGARLFKMHGAFRGPGGVGESYVANQPDLLLWVLATLTDTTIQVFERIPPRGLPVGWQEQFYEESKIAATLLGIPPEVYPLSLSAFRCYMKGMLDGDLLGSTEVCREMSLAIVQHKFSMESLATLLSAGWLPEPLCRRIGLKTSSKQPGRFEFLMKTVRYFYRFAPAGLRYSPAYHQALRRIALAEGRKPRPLENFMNWLALRSPIPLGIPA